MGSRVLGFRIFAVLPNFAIIARGNPSGAAAVGALGTSPACLERDQSTCLIEEQEASILTVFLQYSLAAPLRELEPVPFFGGGSMSPLLGSPQCCFGELDIKVRRIQGEQPLNCLKIRNGCAEPVCIHDATSLRAS